MLIFLITLGVPQHPPLGVWGTKRGMPFRLGDPAFCVSYPIT